MLTSVRLVQWRAHEDTTVPLDPRFTALVGANGTGKTSVLDGLFRMRLALDGSKQLFAGPNSVAFTKRRGSQDESTFVAVTGRGTQAPWELRLRIRVIEGSSADLEISRNTDMQATKLVLPLHLEAELGNDPNGPRSVRSSDFYRLAVERIAAGDAVTSSQARIASDGSGLASVLAEWKLNEPQRYQGWVDDVRSVLPRFRDVRFTRREKEVEERRKLDLEQRRIIELITVKRLYQELLVDFDNEGGIAAAVVSEGTLLVMALLAALHQDPLPRVVMLDDIDRGLHPHAQQELVSMVMKILDRKPETQFIVTTHSPFVVDMLQPEQVVALARNSAGRVVAKRMSEHPKRHLLKQLSMGEFWSAEDEAWVVEEPAIAPETSEPRSHG